MVSRFILAAIVGSALFLDASSISAQCSTCPNTQYAPQYYVYRAPAYRSYVYDTGKGIAGFGDASFYAVAPYGSYPNGGTYQNGYSQQYQQHQQTDLYPYMYGTQRGSF